MSRSAIREIRDETRAYSPKSAVLEAARSGDEKAFERLISEHQASLYAHCYRMVRSRQDADDAMQAASFRAWRAIASFEGRSSVRTWLLRIATNTCLDLIARRRGDVLSPEHPSVYRPDEVSDRSRHGDLQISSSPDDRHGLEEGDTSPEASFEQRETVELAFMAAHQYLPPRQRAVLILREVLGMTASEVAGILKTSSTAVNSALQRARATLRHRNPQRGEQTTARAAGENQLAEIVDRFVDAFVRGEVGVVVALLLDDAGIGTYHRRTDRAEFRPQGGSNRLHDRGCERAANADHPRGHHRPVGRDGWQARGWSTGRGFARSQWRSRQLTE